MGVTFAYLQTTLGGLRMNQSGVMLTSRVFNMIIMN